MSVRAVLALVVLVLLIGSHESTSISDALQKVEDLFVKILGQSNNVISFARFTNKYGKKYQNKEEIKHRFSVFQKNLDLIGSTNKKGLPFKLGVNKFADLTNQEFLRNKFDCSRFGIFKGRHNLTDTTTTPSAKDWTKTGIVSPVRDQGQCEAGWAISSVGAVEAAYRKKYGIGISLSEQQLLDCSTNNKGCDGGAAANAFQYNVERKLNYRSFYPYGGTQGKCRYEPLVVGKLIKSYGVGVSIDENKLKQWVGSIGPVTVGFHVTNSFAFYEEGVYSSDECGDTTKDLNHFMLVVGYGIEDGVPYWLIQNSWGTDWGEKGYIKVEMGKNMCGVAAYAAYPILW
ncbi:thiol protease aleurain-like [Brassica napus]|uniref:thiol protease aleurain-like n=1 Tax=Brassica napus TaxID=3708 RepID=UPI0001B6413D|nr:thiol protease aleurain-like [Brassica napus]